MRQWLERVWYRQAPPPFWLRPLAGLYGVVSQRRAVQARRIQQRLPVPVIVVGNVSIGGTGKTPCTLWLVEQLLAMGFQPGILSRGYGGDGPFPREVNTGDDPAICGDEPVLMAGRSGVPVVVAPDRVAAGHYLLERYPQVDVLVCDDGLQHYRLARDAEFCVVDGVRGYGNGLLLPAGPLRELPARAVEVSMILVNGADAAPFGSHAVRFDLVAEVAINLRSGERRPLVSFQAMPLHAVAGIGHPQRYFDFLESQGLAVTPHAFADHHRYVPSDLGFHDGRPVLMTEKDAVKCRSFACDDWWMVAVDARFEDGGEGVRACLNRALPSAVTSG